MSIPKDMMVKHYELSNWSILHCYRGSIAHGMYEPNTDPNSIDDKDTIGICVPPIQTYLGNDIFGSRGTSEIVRDPWDIVVYEARKAINLLAKGNPNVLSMLWLPENMYIQVSTAGRMLIDQRHLFATRFVYHSFVGYASDQLVKMERGAHKGYMGDKRKRLVEKHGYDTKNAAHLIRILRTGSEFLKDGEMQVERPDAGQLLAIKHGECSLEKVKMEAEHEFKRAQAAYDNSTLPATVDMKAVNGLTMEVILNGLAELHGLQITMEMDGSWQ